MIRCRLIHTIIAASILLGPPNLATAGTLEERVMPAGADEESRAREYQVYLPDGIAADGTASLVMVLHGCRQTEQNMIEETRFTELADEHGFVVVFPFVTGFSEFRIENCWGFWLPEHRTEGSGEVGDLRRIIDAAETEFQTDPNRRYVAGLSSGAAMAVALGVAYSEDIAAIGPVAGLPYAETSRAVSFACVVPIQTRPVGAIVDSMAAEQDDAGERRMVPMMVIHSINDCTVPILNGQNLRDSWIRHHGGDDRPAFDRDCSRDGVPCAHRRFTDAVGRTVVETVFYTGPSLTSTHFWPGDNEGEFANPDGPSASEMLWTFFQDKSLLETRPAEVVVTDVMTGSGTIEISGTAHADAGIDDVRVRLDSDAEVPTRMATLTGEGQWSVSFDGLAPDRFYLPVIIVTLGDGREVSVTSELIALGSPTTIVIETASWQGHLAAHRIGIPSSNCPNSLFGVCDRDFTSLFFEHRFAPFALFAREGEDDWYADRDNITRGD